MKNLEQTKQEKKLLNEAISFVRIHKSKNPSNFKQIEYYEGNKFVCQETLLDNKVVSLLFPSFSETPYQIGMGLITKYVNYCLKQHTTKISAINNQTMCEAPNNQFYVNQFYQEFPELRFNHCGGQLRNPKTNENLTWEQTKTILKSAQIFIDNNQKNQHTISNT